MCNRCGCNDLKSGHRVYCYPIQNSYLFLGFLNFLLHLHHDRGRTFVLWMTKCLFKKSEKFQMVPGRVRESPLATLHATIYAPTNLEERQKTKQTRER